MSTRIVASARAPADDLALRASIEEDYAKRMSKLAKTPLGKDEIG
jgi:hypothetical protein